MENEDKESHTTIYKKYGIPGSIIILDKKYTFKTALANQKQFIYRCIHRKCKGQITIDKDNLLKILSYDKEAIENIQYIEGKNEHTCNPAKIIEINKNNTSGGNENFKLGIELIKKNITKPLQFHINNMKQNIYVNSIKYNLQKLRDLVFPNDSLFLANLKNITITLMKI